MSVRRIGVLLRKEVRQGLTNFFAVYAIFVPIVMSLLVTLVFGDLFATSPRLGVLDEGDSQLAAILTDLEHVNTTAYDSESALRDDVERGKVVMGVIIPADYDATVQRGEVIALPILRWGEAAAKDQLIVNSAIAAATAQIADVERPITLQAEQLGDGEELTWSERLLPILALMSIILGGFLVPSSSLVDEKANRTLSALTTAPATLTEVYLAKAILGVVLSVFMGLATLTINDALGNQPLLLLLVLVLGGMAASVFGVLLGSLVKDVNVLLSVIKATGIILYAPGLLQMFPDLPGWIAQVFPTYYVYNPVLEVGNGAGLGDVAGELAILLAIIGGMLVLLAMIVERQRDKLALTT